VARIREAAQQWKDGGFEPVPGDDEFIPLPEDRPFPRETAKDANGWDRGNA
jgi:hypothetical protein